uniref:Cytochrome p450 n=1 Tax=Epiphyas postvittana TaxID=65032 RepID=A0A0K8TVT9_EPIPO|nr:TPA_inf: cytochrome P450 CYP405A1 [Epiphyas postvittana]
MIFVVALVCVLVALVFLHDYMRKSTRAWALLSKFNGDKGLPIIGNALALGFDSDGVSKILMDLWRKHGMTNYRLTVGSEEWVMLCESDDVGSILGHPTELAKPTERNAAMMPFFGNSVSTSEGERWKSTRKLMTPSFHFKTLEARVETVNSRMGALNQVLDQYVDKAPVDLYRYLRPFMFDILCNTLMGVDHNMLANPDHPYLDASGRIIKIATENYFSYWRNISFIFKLTPIYKEMMDTIKTVRGYSDKLIRERRVKLNKIIDDIKSNNRDASVDVNAFVHEKVSEQACLLDSLLLSTLPNGDPAPDETINEEITLLCFTGHYTTTMTMTHTLYCLAKYPEIQKRVLEEQESIFNNDQLRNPTNHDLIEMKYLEAVIKESIRVIPTVTKIGRQLQNELPLKDGRIIPPGTQVVVYYEALYADPKVFPEPEKYNPERFFNSMHPYAFVPFSAGPRNCIGFRYAWVAMKASLSNLLRRYEVLPGNPEDEPKFAHRIITESTNGVKLRLKKRE